MFFSVTLSYRVVHNSKDFYKTLVVLLFIDIASH